MEIPQAAYATPSNTTRFYPIYTQSLVINTATQTTETINTYQTTIQGKIVGGSLLYNQTFDQAYGSASVQSGVSAARLAITTNGGPGVVISAPLLINHSVNTSLQTQSTYTLNHVAAADHITTVEYVGGTGSLALVSLTTGYSLIPDPAYNGVQTLQSNGVNSTAPVVVGTLSDCSAAAASLPSGTRPTCAALPGHQIRSGSGGVSYVTTTNDTYYVDQADTVTNTNLTSETYLIQGVVKPIGVIHAVAAQAAIDVSEGFWQRSLTQLAGEGAGHWHPWIAGWGQSRGTSAWGSMVADQRTGTGIDGGVVFAIGPRLLVAGGISSGIGHLGLGDGSESGRLDQVDGGLFARLGGDAGVSLRVGAGLGGGHVVTGVTIPGIDGVASARETVRTRWATAEISDRIVVAAGALAITPLIGLGYTHTRLGGFVEAGSPYALTAAAATQHRLREWAGATVDVPVTPALRLTASLRAVHYDGDTAPRRAVNFAQYPVAGGLLVDAAPMARWAGSGAVGAELRVLPHLTLFASGELLAQDSTTDKAITFGIRSNF